MSEQLEQRPVGVSIEVIVNLMVEGILKANVRNYAWSLGFLRRFIELGMTLEKAFEIWTTVHGSSEGPVKAFHKMVLEMGKERG